MAETGLGLVGIFADGAFLPLISGILHDLLYLEALAEIAFEGAAPNPRHWLVAGLVSVCASMIPKSGGRLSEKIRLKMKNGVVT